jgi:superkiller protein 3
MWKFPVFFILFISLLTSCNQFGKSAKDNSVIVSPIQALNDSIVNDSLNVQLLNRRAQYFIREKQLNNALLDINKALKIDSKEPDLFLSLAEIYFQLGKNENCTSALLKVLELNPDETDAYNKLSQLNLLNQRFDIALGYNDKSLAIDKFNAKTLYVRGMVFLAKEDTLSAMRNFLLARDIKNDFYEALIQIGAIYNKQHNPLAGDYLKETVRLFPESAQSRYELALYLQENGNPNAAMAQYDTMLIMFPSNKYVFFNIGYLYLVFDQRFDSALFYFDRSLSIDPQYVDALYNKGRTLEEMGKLNAARDIYQDVLKYRTNYDLAIEALNRLDRKK